MLDVKLDTSSAVPLHDQAAAQIRRAIAEAEAKPGERLPSARHLAAVMHVNTNTVLRALRTLRDEGLLEMRPGRGTRVSGTPQRSALLAKAIELVKLSRESGYDRSELLAIIEQLP
ncbi:MAG TPA: GntR family transcriptional regulator [Solirubrobacteraceae bacterium]|nr:GntR family transcriptional regulator [Solirubrobacteraceae bacterium]